VPSGRRKHRAPWVADEIRGTHTRPTAAAFASLNWPFKHDAKFERLAKYRKANIHAAFSHVHPINLPTRFREDPKLITHALLAGKFQGVPTSDLYPFYNECDEAKNFSITLLVEAQAEGIEGVTESATESRV
jgi:hypothetical protein